MRNKCFAVILLTVFGLAVISVFAQDEPQNSPIKPAEGRISLDLKGVDIVELLRIISLKTNKTIVPSKGVSGRITIFINNVTFEDALDIVLLSQDLACEKKGDISYVLTGAEYKRMYGKEYIEPRELKIIKLNYAKPANVFNALSQVKSDIGKIVADEASGTIILIDIPEKLTVLEKTIRELDQALTTTVMDLNYAKPADAKAQLSAAITPGTGEVIVDERSKKVIISDLPKKMEKLQDLVRALDEETKQVFIEAEIVQVSLDDKFQRGIDWEKVFSGNEFHGLDFAGYFPVALSQYQKIAVGTLETDHYKLILNFLQTYGDTKVLSQPRLAVVDNEEAAMMVGTREAYVTQTQSQAQSTTVTSESVEFIDVGIKLKITPKINQDGFVTMKIKPEISSLGTPLTTASGSKIPIVQTSEAETTVKVKDGVMVMIAGLRRHEKTDTVVGVPLLSRLPLLKGIFSSHEKEDKTTELIVFLTPRLMKGDAALSGTEPEKFIPYEMMSTDLREKIASRKLETISHQEIESQAPADAAIGLEKHAVESDKTAVSKEREEVISRSLSGIKEPEAAVQQESLALVGLPEMILPGQPDKAALAGLPADAPVAGLPEKTTPTSQVKPIPRKQKEKAKKKEGLFTGQVKEYYLKGLTFQEAGNFDEAFACYQKAILLDADYAPAYNQLGVLLEAKGLVDQAGEMYLKAVRADPDYPASLSNLALLYEARNNFKEAAAYWQRRAEMGGADDDWAQRALKRARELRIKNE